MSGLPLVLDRLEKVRRSGKGWTARCPAHEDRTPSLSIAEGDNGRPLLHCHAGCSPESILEAVGLGWGDLLEREGEGERRRIVATYAYHDEQGEMLFEVVRRADKSFTQRRPDGRGGWVWNLDGVRRVLYRLPYVVQAVKYGYPVWIAEGEKDVDALIDAGVIATCNPGGAAKWRPEFAQALAGATELVIVADRDEEGRKHAATVARSVSGDVATVRIVGAKTGKDAADHLAAGHGLDEFEPLSLDPEAPDEEVTEPGHGLEVLTARALYELPDPPESDRLLGSLVVRRQRVVLGAHTGEGKTTMALWIVRAVAEGDELLDWTGQGDSRALVIDAEQGLATIKRRLREVGLHESEQVDYVRVPDGLQLDSDAKHVAEVERILRDGRYAVVVADPLYKLHTGDSNAEREAVELMRRLDRWRDELGFGLVLPVHLRKPIPGVKFSIHEIFGSSAYVRGAEVVLGLRRVSNGFAELHFFKDRDGDLPVGEKWALLFDRETGFRRAQEEDDEAALADRLLDFVRENPGLSTKKVTAQVKGRKKTLTRILRTDDRFESRRRGQADLWYEATTERLFPGDGNPPEHPSPAEPGNPVPDGGASPVGTAPTGTGSDQVVPAEPEHPSDGGEVKGA